MTTLRLTHYLSKTIPQLCGYKNGSAINIRGQPYPDKAQMTTASGDEYSKI